MKAVPRVLRYLGKCIAGFSRNGHSNRRYGHSYDQGQKGLTMVFVAWLLDRLTSHAWDWDWDWSTPIQGVQEQKSVGENRSRQKNNMNLLSIVVATSTNMTSVQGGKILADVRTGSFRSGPLCPANQHMYIYTIDRQPVQHVQMATTTPRRQSEGLSLRRGSSWNVLNVNSAGLRVYRRLKKSHRYWKCTCTDKQAAKKINCELR